MTLKIDAAFDGGNIDVVRTSGTEADLSIRTDSNGPWLQWFNFRVNGAAGQAVTLRIVNAGACTYLDGWEDYRARVSEDGGDWLSAKTTYRDGVLEIQHTCQSGATQFAYFAPYDLARHEALLNRAAADPAVTRRTLGSSVDGRDIDCLSIGEGERPVWIVGRQHCGETMASWWMDGAFARLLDASDPLARHLRQVARIHIVPLVNIDGAARGNHRGNALGVDLNRQWHEPNPKTAPEVACILGAMAATGADAFLDVHGDEGIPNVFIDGCDMDPQATPAQVAGVERFRQALLKASPAFQTAVGYPQSYGGEEAPGMATRSVARRFGAVAITLEMPFKDSPEAPDPKAGWSPAACAQLGHDCLYGIAAILDRGV